MGARASWGMRIAAVLALGATTPGCLTALAAATGASGSTMQAALDADLAVLGAIAGVQRDDEEELYASSDPYGEPVYRGAEEAGTFLCVLPHDEPQWVRAYSEEGARAACLMSNDVDLAGGGCRCVERSAPH